MSLNDIEKQNREELFEYIKETWPDINAILTFMASLLDSGSLYAIEVIESMGEKAYEKWNDGTNYEESIATADVRVIDNLRDEMEKLVAFGVTLLEAAEYVSERFYATRVHDLSRIMVTEKTRIDAANVIERGDRYIYHCVHDSRTCMYCDALDGAVFLSSEGVIGENLPPMHPWCRCWVTDE